MSSDPPNEPPQPVDPAEPPGLLVPGAPGPQLSKTPAPASALATVSLGFSILGFLASIIPFAGFVGTIGLILGLIDKSRPDLPGKPRSHGQASGGIALGAIGTVAGIAWALIFYWVSTADWHASCPHLYAYDGQEYRLDADLASGAIFEAAEREDLDRLESLREVNGQYRLRVKNDLSEVDHIDRLSLLVVDHDPNTEVLPTPSGSLLELRGGASPLSAVDERGADLLPKLAQLDGAVVVSPALPGAEPVSRWTLEFPRPAGDQAVLILRGHSTPFAEDAVMRYLSRMGQGMEPLLQWAQAADPDEYRQRLAQEITRFGLPMKVSVSAGGAWIASEAVPPTSPAILRSQALVIPLPPPTLGHERVAVLLESTPQFWEVDQVELAPLPSTQIESTRLTAREAVLASGGSVTERLLADDRQRVVLHPGESFDAVFEAPPIAPGMTRTVVSSLRGYYDMPVGGPRGLNVAAVAAHHFGLTSLPRFASRE